MTFSAYERLFIYATLLLGLFTVIASDEVAPVFWILPFIGLGVSIANDMRGGATLLPNGTLSTVAAVAFGVADFMFLADNYLVAVLDLVLLLFAIKLLGGRAVRDNLQLIGLSFLLVLATSVMAADVSFGIILLVYMFCVLTALVLENLRGHWESSGGETSVLARSRGVLGNAFGATMFLLGCGILVFTMVIYFAFPRVGLRLWQTDMRRQDRIAGFSERVELGSVGRIQSNSAIALRVAYEGESLPPINDPRRKIRGIALDRFDGDTWEATGERLTRVVGGRREWRLRPGTPRETISVSPSSDYAGVLFLPSGAVTLHGDFQDIRKSNTGNFTIDRRQGRRLTYDVGVADVPVETVEEERYLQLPDTFSSRVTALADEWAGEITGEALATAMTQRLRSQFGYSTDLDEQTDYSIERFLFVDKRGHCELFATSLAVLLRSRGVPTRLVNGFSGGERWDEHSLIFRESHAHSWVEAYFPGQGWVAFDPTPPDNMAVGLLRRIENGYYSIVASVRFFWGKWFVDYDVEKQRQVAQDFREASEKVGANLSADGFRRWVKGAPWQTWAKRGVAGAGLLAIIAIVYARWATSPARRLLRKSKLSKLYEKRLRMAERVEARKPGQTPLAYAFLIASHENWRSFVRYTELYYKMRYGRPSPGDGVRFLEIDRQLGRRQRTSS